MGIRMDKVGSFNSSSVTVTTENCLGQCGAIFPLVLAHPTTDRANDKPLLDCQRVSF